MPKAPKKLKVDTSKIIMLYAELLKETEPGLPLEIRKQQALAIANKREIKLMWESKGETFIIVNK